MLTAASYLVDEGQLSWKSNSRRRELERCSSRLPLLVGAALVWASAGCGAPDDSRPGQGAPPDAIARGDLHFTEVTQESGIKFEHAIGDAALSNLVESTGGGAAFLDYDQDGHLDLFAVSGSYVEGVSDGRRPRHQATNRLLKNLGNGTFADVTEDAGVAREGYGVGVMVGDYDNDGYPDIYVANFGPNALFRNNRNGTFSEVGDSAGVAGNNFSVGGAWLDYDNDGYLDLYVGNYIAYDPDLQTDLSPDGFPGPLSYAGEPDALYHNRGDGTFEDVTVEMGVFRPDGRAMGIGAADFNNDGFVDVFVANDAMENYLYINQSGRSFRERASAAGVALNFRGNATSSMTVTFGDYDGDGRVDMFVPDMSYGSLYRNEGNDLFTDMTHRAGLALISNEFVGWAAAFIDYDNDGDADIFQVNGDDRHLYGQADALLENLGDGRFRNVSASKGAYFRRELVGRGAAFGDYDNDGDMDAFIVNLNDRGVLLRNEGGNLRSWITLHLVGQTSSRDAIDAIVTLTAGSSTQAAQKTSASSYLSQNDPRLHFGLGDATRVDWIEIRWPSGARQVLENVAARQILTVVEPKVPEQYRH